MYVAKVNYKQAIWEASKEPLRLLAIALIPLAISYFTALSFEWAGIIILVLRYADKILHELGKAQDNDVLVGGLVRF